ASTSSGKGAGKRPASSNEAQTSANKKARTEKTGPAADDTGKDDPKPKSTRGARACTVCRRLKMKCVGAEQGPPCKRCATGNHECIFEESNRGKRSSKKHELITRSLKKMERTLDTVLRSIGNPSIASGMLSRSPSPASPSANGTTALLGLSPDASPSASFHREGSPKLHSLPDNNLNPLGLLVEASLANRRASGAQTSGVLGSAAVAGHSPHVGVASANYFKPGPMAILPLRRLYIERQVQPEMLSFVKTEEVIELFKIYFDNLNIHCNLLDPTFHTPSLVCSRSPILLTTICAIASKFYPANPALRPRLTELAHKLAFSVPAKGYKSLEIIQAYLLLSLWGCNAVERYEMDQTWFLLGMAIRMATDLNLHRQTAVNRSSTPEGTARELEVHNRERTWIVCFVLDRSFSSQMGKPHCIREDNTIRSAREWALRPTAVQTDASIAGYCELQRLMSRCIDFLYSSTDSSSGLHIDFDYVLIIQTFEQQLADWGRDWRNIVTKPAEMTRYLQYRKIMSSFYFHYALLVLNSFGLQNALDHAPMNIGHFFGRCHSAAVTCATLVRDELGPQGFLKYSPDSHCVQISYAVLSLLKLLRPEFQAYLENEQNTLSLVKGVADTLVSVAAYHLHTPALYGGFLHAVISAKLRPHQQQTMQAQGTTTNGLAPSGRLNPAMVYSGAAGAIHDPAFSHMNEFSFESEMGPVADISTFPPTMASSTQEDFMAELSMDNILSNGFWDSVVVPGYNRMDGMSGGFLFGTGGSGLITPRFGASPLPSGMNSPTR
ncbi:hypothetical protein FISHEDRAFT_31353, partial [Fistulina hepatica ATCC 64428]